METTVTEQQLRDIAHKIAVNRLVDIGWGDPMGHGIPDDDWQEILRLIRTAQVIIGS